MFRAGPRRSLPRALGKLVPAQSHPESIRWTRERYRWRGSVRRRRAPTDTVRSRRSETHVLPPGKCPTDHGLSPPLLSATFEKAEGSDGFVSLDEKAFHPQFVRLRRGFCQGAAGLLIRPDPSSQGARGLAANHGPEHLYGPEIILHQCRIPWRG